LASHGYLVPSPKYSTSWILRQCGMMQNLTISFNPVFIIIATTRAFLRM
jgi:hypothetical protein